MPLATDIVKSDPTPVTEEKVYRWLPAILTPTKFQTHALCAIDTATGLFSPLTGASGVLFDGIVDEDLAVARDPGPAFTQRILVRKPGRIKVKILNPVVAADLLKKVYVVPNDDSTVQLNVPVLGNNQTIGTIDTILGPNLVVIRPIYQTQ